MVAGHFSQGGFDEGMTKGTHGDQGLAIGRKTMQPVFDFIDRCSDAEQPFFVWYAPMLPHSLHDPEKSFVEHYESKADSIHIAKYWGMSNALIRLPVILLITWTPKACQKIRLFFTCVTTVG